MLISGISIDMLISKDEHVELEKMFSKCATGNDTITRAMTKKLLNILDLSPSLASEQTYTLDQFIEIVNRSKQEQCKNMRINKQHLVNMFCEHESDYYISKVNYYFSSVPNTLSHSDVLKIIDDIIKDS